MTAAEREAEARRREALRDQHKLIYRALYAAGEGAASFLSCCCMPASCILLHQHCVSVQKLCRCILLRIDMPPIAGQGALDILQ